MFISAKTIVFAFVVISCVNKIFGTCKKRFCFKDTFVIPKRCPHDCPREHDDCEILERSRFDSSEESSECKNCRFLKSRFKDDDVDSDEDDDDDDEYDNTNPMYSKRNRFPYKNEIFIEKSSKRRYGGGCRRSPQGSFYQYTNYSPIYMPPVWQPPLLYGLPCYCGPNYMHPPPDYLFCESGYKQNTFQIPKLKNRKKINSKKDAPIIYFYNKKKDGSYPTLEEIRNKPVSTMTSEEWKLLDEYLNRSCESSESEEDDSEEDRSPCKPKPRPCFKKKCSHKTTTVKCLTKPTTKACPTRKRKRRTRTTKCPKRTTTTTSCYTASQPLSTTYKSTECPAETTTKRSRTRRRRRSTRNNTKCPKQSTTMFPQSSTSCHTTTYKSTNCPGINQTTNENACPKEPPRCICNNDILITRVVHPASCTSKPKNDSCLAVSDNINFMKFNFDDLGTHCGCSSKDTKVCSTRCKKKSDKDMDYLLSFDKCPVDDAPSNPCNCRVDMYPWWYYTSQSCYPFRYHSPDSECFNCNSRFDERYYPYPIYFQPLNWCPPWLKSQSNRREEPHRGCKKRRRCSSKY